LSDIISDHEMPEHYKSGHLWGHPKGLYVLFLTEVWERFSFYGMRALLVLYLTKHFLFSDEKAYLIYGAYGSLVYLMPVIGGIIADRYLGSRKAVTFGAILLVLGHFGMAFEGPQAFASGGDVVRSDLHLKIFFLSLALIITGVGFLKANISTTVGALYEKHDLRRDSGFTIFYMGINLGALAAPILCGWLGETYGWQYGFGLAGIGMLAGLIVFLKGQHLLEGHAEPPEPEVLREKVFVELSREVLIYIFGIAMVGISWLFIQRQDIVGIMTNSSLFFMMAIIVGYGIIKCDKEERGRIVVALVLILASVVFWMLFEQAGSSLTLLTDRALDRSALGRDIPTTWFQSVNPGLIVAMAPLFAMLWPALSKRGWEPSTPVKFALGLLQVGLGFVVLVWGMSFAEGDAKVALIWMLLLYLFHTTGELCLSPVGLSMITKLSPPKIIGMMMGTWFLGSAAASFIAGKIAGETAVELVDGEVANLAVAKAQYAEVYIQLSWVAFGAAIVLLVISPWLKKAMHGVH